MTSVYIFLTISQSFGGKYLLLWTKSEWNLIAHMVINLSITCPYILKRRFFLDRSMVDVCFVVIYLYILMKKIIILLRIEGISHYTLRLFCI